MAMRSLLRHLRQQHPERAPRYLLLFGKATYDPRNLLGNDMPTLATYETAFSFDDDGVSYSSDDMMGYLDDDESGSSSQSLDVSVGRLPAKDEAEANHMVDKIEGYMMRRDLGADAVSGNAAVFVPQADNQISEQKRPCRVSVTKQNYRRVFGTFVDIVHPDVAKGHSRPVVDGQIMGFKRI